MSALRRSTLSFFSEWKLYFLNQTCEKVFVKVQRGVKYYSNFTCTILPFYIVLAATPLKASSGTLNVWCLKKNNVAKESLSNFYDTLQCNVGVSIREERISIYCDFSCEGGGTLPQNSYKPSWDL